MIFPLRKRRKYVNIVKLNLIQIFLITHYLSKKRSFYAKDNPVNPQETLSFDFLFRGEEITTAGMRINNFKELEDKMVRRGMNPKDFECFTMVHRYGLSVHGGLGLGLEGLTQKVIGSSSVKLATLFPRDEIDCRHKLLPVVQLGNKC